MRGLHDFGRVLAIALYAMVSGVALAACTAGTEPSTNPREQRTDPDDTGRVSGRVVTSGTTRSWGSREEAEADDSTTGRWIEVGPLAGEAMGSSQPLAGVVVELGIVHFDRSSDSAPAGPARSAVTPFAVPDAWVGPEPRFLDPGPAAPPGRFQVIAQATTNGRGEFRFSRAPRREMLMLRARPPAPYLETYSHTPFWLANEPAKEVDVVLRASPVSRTRK